MRNSQDGKWRKNQGQLAFGETGEGEARNPSPEGTEPPAAERSTERPAKATGLMEVIVSPENMKKALKRVMENKGAPGPDGMTTTELPLFLSQNWQGIREELLSGTYRPQPVRRVGIPKPDGGVRKLGIPSVRDRVVQQVLLDILTPIFDPDFHPSSYGYRPGRSCHQAITKASLFMRQYELNWVVDMDLSKCFDTLKHDFLLTQVRRKVADGSILNLIKLFLESGVMTDTGLESTEEGSPQGGVISPLLANIYLDYFDQWSSRKLTKRNGGRPLKVVIQELNPILRGFANYFRIANCKGKFRELMQWIRRRLRAKQMMLWKKSGKLHRALRQQGHKGDFKAIKMGSWRNAACQLAHMALPNKSFEELGLYSMDKVETGISVPLP